METDTLASWIRKIITDLKAFDPIQFDLNHRSSLADVIIICHGSSTAHVRGIAEKLWFTLKKQGVPAMGTEGMEEGEWILMDYNSVIVHIMLEETRRYYQLEEIYQEYPSLKFG